MADYTSIAEVRAMDQMDDVTIYPDATVTEAIDWAEELIDRVTGTSWVYKSFSVVLDGSAKGSINLVTEEGRPILYPRAISSATVDGVSQTTTNWRLMPTGKIIRDDGYFTYTHPGGNVVIAGTAGKESAAPNDIKWCARTLARQYLLDLDSRVPDRAMSLNTQDGTISISQATAHPDRPTSLPEVNARLVRRRQYHSYI